MQTLVERLFIVSVRVIEWSSWGGHWSLHITYSFRC